MKCCWRISTSGGRARRHLAALPTLSPSATRDRQGRAQCGHFARRPACSSFVRSRFPHWQVTTTSCCGVVPVHGGYTVRLLENYRPNLVQFSESITSEEKATIHGSG